MLSTAIERLKPMYGFGKYRLVKIKKKSLKGFC